MAALAAPDGEGFVAWTERGIDLAEPALGSDRYWLGPLLNNLGWHHYDAGEYQLALNAFERALEEREHDQENRPAIELGLYAIAKALRALERPGDGVPLLERAVSSAASESRSDGWLHEELAESYAALGRAADARDHAEKALALLTLADTEFAQDGERAQRLRRIAGAAAYGP